MGSTWLGRPATRQRDGQARRCDARRRGSRDETVRVPVGGRARGRRGRSSGRSDTVVTRTGRPSFVGLTHDTVVAIVCWFCLALPLRARVEMRNYSIHTSDTHTTHQQYTSKTRNGADTYRKPGAQTHIDIRNCNARPRPSFEQSAPSARTGESDTERRARRKAKVEECGIHLGERARWEGCAQLVLGLRRDDRLAEQSGVHRRERRR